LTKSKDFTSPKKVLSFFAQRCYNEGAKKEQSRPVKCQAPEGKKIKIFSPPGACGGEQQKQQSSPPSKGSEESTRGGYGCAGE
jgi:hypothetical protein